MTAENKKRIRWITGAVLAVVLLFAVYAGRGMLAENPFQTESVFDQPSHAVTGPDGSLIITDGGKTRVTVLKDEKVNAVFRGTKSENGFFYAEHTASDGEKIYVADVKYAEGSTRVASERIMRFSYGGRYEKTLFERVYTDDMLFQYGNILDMRFGNGALMFLMKNGDALELYSLDGSGAYLIRGINTENAPHLCNAVYDIFSDEIYAVSKDGLIYKENEKNSFAMLGGPRETGMIPWETAIDKNGNLYITDLTVRGIINSDGALFCGAENIVYRLDINENGVFSFTDNESVFQLDPDGNPLFAEAGGKYGAGYFALRLAVWLSAVIMGLALLYAASRLLLWFIKKNRGRHVKYKLVIIVSMLLTSLIVAVSMIGTSLEQNEKKIEYNITQVITSVSGLSGRSFGDDLESINSLADYGGPAFSRVREALDPICESAYDQGEYLYYVLFKVKDGAFYGIMDYEDTTGVIYPLGECPEEYLDILEGKTSYLYEKGSDAYGSWTYAVAPVYNSRNEVAGLIEIGSNLDVETIRVNKQIQDIVLSTAVLLVLFLLIFTEAAALMDVYSQKSASCAGRIPELIRPLIFLAFLADSTCAAFIPQLSAKILGLSDLSFTASIGAALPLSAHLFFIAAVSVFSGRLIDRFGMRVMLAAGLITQMAGLGLTAAAVSAKSYFTLFAGMGLSGCGLGIVVVSGNTLSASFEDENRKTALFSGVNVGLVSGVVVGTVLGSYSAQAAGHAATFALSAVVLFPALWFAFKCASKSHGPALPAQLDKITDQKMGVRRFLQNRSVFSFLLFSMFPFLTILCFKDFVFPLFASEQGVSEVAIGQTLLFAGAVSILIAPSVSAALLKRLGTKGTNILMGALFAGGLLLFAASPSLRTAVITVYILTTAGCVGLVAQGVHFSAIRASKSFGAGRSMGVYSLFDNLSQTAGPLLFGAVLIFGYQTAGLIIGITAAALLVLFAFIGENQKRS